MRPSEAELGDLSLACERLWHLDSNRAEPGRDYHLNLQVALPPPQQSSALQGSPLRHLSYRQLVSYSTVGLSTLLQAM